MKSMFAPDERTLTLMLPRIQAEGLPRARLEMMVLAHGEPPQFEIHASRLVFLPQREDSGVRTESLDDGAILVEYYVDAQVLAAVELLSLRRADEFEDFLEQYALRRPQSLVTRSVLTILQRWRDEELVLALLNAGIRKGQVVLQEPNDLAVKAPRECSWSPAP